jgi:DNA-binding MarR family transcriptional regulator
VSRHHAVLSCHRSLILQPALQRPGRTPPRPPADPGGIGSPSHRSFAAKPFLSIKDTPWADFVQRHRHLCPGPADRGDGAVRFGHGARVDLFVDQRPGACAAAASGRRQSAPPHRRARPGTYWPPAQDLEDAAVTETSPEQADRPYRLEDQVGFLLRLAGQRHAAIFQDMAPDGLTPTQFAALVRLAELGDCSQNELGRRTAMDVATVKGVVDRLRAKGLVRAHPDPADRRRTILSVAPAVRARIASLHAAGFAISRATLEPLTETEAETLVALLRRISGP